VKNWLYNAYLKGLYGVGLPPDYLALAYEINARRREGDGE